MRRKHVSISYLYNVYVYTVCIATKNLIPHLIYDTRLLSLVFSHKMKDTPAPAHKERKKASKWKTNFSPFWGKNVKPICFRATPQHTLRPPTSRYRCVPCIRTTIEIPPGSGFFHQDNWRFCTHTRSLSRSDLDAVKIKGKENSNTPPKSSSDSPESRKTRSIEKKNTHTSSNAVPRASWERRKAKTSRYCDISHLKYTTSYFLFSTFLLRSRIRSFLVIFFRRLIFASVTGLRIVGERWFRKLEKPILFKRAYDVLEKMLRGLNYIYKASSYHFVEY